MPLAALIPVAALLSLLWWLLASGGSLAGGGLPRFLLLYGAAALGYLAALACVGGRARGESPAWALPVIIGAALLARLVWLGGEPTLSGDAYRYLWEGRIQWAGFNPYALAPTHAALTDLRDGVWVQINSPDVSTIYGPLLQLGFAFLALCPGKLVPFQLGFVACDLALGAVVLVGLRRRGLSPLLVVAYLWHPLVILETAGQVHLEAVAVFLFLLALELELHERPRLAALALGCAIVAKYLPVLLVPAFLLRTQGWRARCVRLGLIAVPGLLCLLPYLDAGGGLLGGLGAYGRTWRFNEGAFALIDAGLDASGISAAFCRGVLPLFLDVDPGFDPAEHTTWMRIPPKLLIGAIVLAVIAWLSRPRDGRVELERLAFAAGALFVLLSPTVHPWYLLWLVPFLPAPPVRRGRAAWLYLSLAVPLSYEILVRYTGMPETWAEAPWVRLAEYLPCLALLFLAPGRGLPVDPQPAPPAM